MRSKRGLPFHTSAWGRVQLGALDLSEFSSEWSQLSPEISLGFRNKEV